jgi:hypothetical protein
MQENMNLEPTEILPFLYLGNQRNSTDIQALEGIWMQDNRRSTSSLASYFLQ